MTEIELTEEQQATALRIRKTRAALHLAADTVEQLARRILPEGGRTERGESVDEARIPFRGHVLDDANELYGMLVEGVIEFAEQLQHDAPVAAAFAKWQRRFYLDDVDGAEVVQAIDSVFGLPDRFTAGGAGDLTRSLTGWLLARVERIDGTPGGIEFFDDVMRTVWKLRHRHRLTDHRTREASPRPCPVCGADVLVTFFDEPFATVEARGDLVPLIVSNATERRDPHHRAGALVLDVRQGITVYCSVCNWTPTTTPRDLATWIDGDRSHTRDQPLPPGRRDLRDPNDVTWTAEQAAAHFGVKPRTIKAWIRDGSVTQWPGGLLHRDELLAAFRTAREARKAGQLR